MYVIEFEDHGQDFLRWTVDGQGSVVDCQPAQGWMWCGMKVLERPQIGGKVRILNHEGQQRWIVHPVRHVRSVGDQEIND